MIVFVRLSMAVFGVGILFALISGLTHLIPCPQIKPPPGLTSDLLNTWSWVVFWVCLFYVAIQIRSFQVWAATLGPALAIGFVLAFSTFGEWRFAYFLAIQCAITIGVSLTFNAVATGLADMLNWSPWTLKLIALPAAFAAANGWGYVQAIGFAQSLC